MRSLSWFGLRAASERKGRSALGAAGIALGVALFTGALVTAGSTAGAIDRFVEEASGRSDIVAVPAAGALASLDDPGPSDLPSATVARLAALPDVEEAVGVVGFASALTTAEGATTAPRLNQGPPAAVLGFDLASGVFPVTVIAGQLPGDGAAEVAVAASVADDLGLAPGDTVTVASPTGGQAATVVGVLEARGIGRLAGLVLTSEATAARFRGVSGVVSQVAARLAPGTDTEAWLAINGDALGGGVRVQRASRALDLFRDQLALLTATLTASATGVLLIGGFLVYLTLSLTVVERTRLYGTFQALGATRRQVRRLVITEAVALGAVATPVGLAVGVLVAKVLNAAAQRLLVQGGAGPVLDVRPGALVAGGVMGMAVTVGSSLLPARRAAHLDPVAAMRHDHVADPRLSRAWIVGAAALGVGGLVLAVGSGRQRLLYGLLLVLVGAVLLVPPVLRPLASALGALTSRFSPGPGRVAVRHLARERTRSAYTLALVMLVMALALSMGSVSTSFTRTFDRQLDLVYGDDLGLLGASAFSPAFLTTLEKHPAVRGIAAVGEGTSELTGPDGPEPVQLRAIDPDAYFEVAGFGFVDGDRASATAALRRGGALILPATTATRLGVDRGDSIELRTVDGLRPFTVAATVEYNNGIVTVHVGAGDGRDAFGIRGSSDILVGVAPGWEPAVAAESIEADLGGLATFITVTTDDRKADTRAQIAGGTNGFFVLIFLAAFVGVFGLANTLAVSITQRSREIGVLRAIGARRRQVRAIAVIESATLVAVAFVLAVPLGALLSGPLLRGAAPAIGDFAIDHVFPWQALPALAAGGAVIGALAAAWPARRATALDIDTALRFE